MKVFKGTNTPNKKEIDIFSTLYEILVKLKLITTLEKLLRF